MGRSSMNRRALGTMHLSMESITIATQRCYAWGTSLNNVMTLPGGKHRLVENHILCVIFYRQILKSTNPPLGNHAPGSFPSPDKRLDDVLQVGPTPSAGGCEL
jgi:hypothetical protein